MNLRVFENLNTLNTAAARDIEQRVALGARTVALSGGSTPKGLYALLGKSGSLRAAPITWVVVDERYVPIDHPESNAGMIQKTLFADGMSPSHRFLRFHTDLDDPELTAREFEEAWRAQNIGDLDLVLLGMGDDGHTASLFPGTEVLQVEDRIAAAVFVPRLDSWRVTITKPVIRAAKSRMVIVDGASKKPILEQMRAGADYPIAQATRDTPDTWWFVTRPAAPADAPGSDPST